PHPPPLVFPSRSRPPPRPPLFPYTTLFRSRRPNRFARRLDHLFQRDAFVVQLHGVHLHLDLPIALSPDRYVGHARHAGQPTYRSDRKSTRLNSSHRTISYAVFCLKKKKTIA